MRQDAIVVAGQQRQQLELLRRQPDLGVVANARAGGRSRWSARRRESTPVSALSSGVATRRSATRMRASSSSGPNGLVT